MKVAIIYASNAGSNYMVGKVLEEEMKLKGHEILFKKAKDSTIEDIQEKDLVILGSPSWLVNGKEGQPHEYMTEFMSKLGELEGRKFAFFGCGDKSYLEFCGAVDEMERIMGEKKVEKYCESLRINHFFFHLEENLKIAKEWGGKIY